MPLRRRAGRSRRRLNKEKQLIKQVGEMDDKIISLQKQVRDLSSEVNYYKRNESKFQENEQEFIKRIFILEEFMIRSHSVIQRRASRHMKTLKKAMNLDMKIFDTLMQKQEWTLKLEENKKQLTNSIKELEDFSKSFSGMNVNELERLKTKINEDRLDEKEENDEQDEHEDKIEKDLKDVSGEISSIFSP